MARVRVGQRGQVPLIDEWPLLNEQIVALRIVSHVQFVLVAIDQHAVECRRQVRVQRQLPVIGEIFAQHREFHGRMRRAGLLARRARVERQRALLLELLPSEFFDHLTFEMFGVHGRRTLGELDLLVVNRPGEIVVHVSRGQV